MSQFRKIGLGYVSQWLGDDINAGTDPTLPKKTIAALASSANLVIVGSGVYKGVGAGVRNLEADGEVVIDFTGVNPITNSQQNYKGVRIRNAVSEIITTNFENCIIETDIFQTFFQTSIDNFDRGARLCSFLGNVRSRTTTLSRIRIQFNSFFGAIANADNDGNNVLWIETLRFNFFSKITTLYLLQTAIDNSDKTWYDNCICGPVKVGATTYELKKDIDGNTRSDANGSLADVIAVWPDVYSTGNFASADPKVLDEANRIVDQTSDLLKKKGILGFIGGAQVGKFFAIEAENFSVTFTDIEEVTTGVYKIVSGQPFGKIRITGKVSDNLISLQKLNLQIPFNFDGDEIGGSVLNNNVPDAYNGLLGTDVLGDKPERLRFEIRTSQQANANRVTSSDWDNGFIGNVGQFYLMEYGQPLTFHDVAGTIYGNANKTTINPDTILPFFYRSIDLIITLSNTREI